MAVPSALDQPHHDGAALHVPERGAGARATTVAVFVRVPARTTALTGAWVRTTPGRRAALAATGRSTGSTASETWWRCDVDDPQPADRLPLPARRRPAAATGG